MNKQTKMGWINIFHILVCIWYLIKQSNHIKPAGSSAVALFISTFSYKDGKFPEWFSLWILLDLAMMRFCCIWAGWPGTSSLCPDRLCTSLLGLTFHGTNARVESSCCLLAQYPALCLQRSNGNIIHQVVHESHSNFYLKRVQVHQANTIALCCSKVRAALGHFSHPGTQENLRGQTYEVQYGDGHISAS